MTGERAAGRVGRSATLMLAAVSGAVALAWWLVPASVHIASWSRETGVERIAVVAPARGAWIPLCAGLLLFLAFLVVPPRTASGRARRAYVVAPLLLLWAWALPFMPWLGDRVPLVVALAGPVRWGLLAIALTAVVARLVGGEAVERLSRRLPGRGVVFALGFAAYVCCGWRSLSVVGLGGDEPHYVVITHSLLVDHDVQIENNHTQRDYRSFYGGDLRPDYLVRGVNGAIYSIHAPGLPALLLPAYALLGVRGAVATIALFAALAGLAIFDVASRIGGRSVGWLTWALTGWTVPFIPHAWAIYPEMAGAVIVAWAVAWIAPDVLNGPDSRDRPDRPDRPDGADSPDRTDRAATTGLDADGRSQRGPSVAAWAWRGLVLALLPWLHTKFVVLLAGLSLALLFRIREVRKFVAFAVPMAISGALWVAFFWVVYGSVDPQAPYGGYTAQFVRLENVPRSLLGTLFDQKFGLFVYAPIYVVAIAGAWRVFNRPGWRGATVACVAIAVAFAAGSLRLYMWWGGSSAPARFLVPLVPLLAPLLAGAIDGARTATWRRGLLVLCSMVSLAIAASGVIGADRFWLFSSPHGASRLLEGLQGSAPWTAALPTFTEENWRAPVRLLWPWVVAALTAWGVGRVVLGRRIASAFWAGVADATVFIAVGAALSGPFTPSVRAESVQRGRFELADRFDPVRLRAFDLTRFRKVLPPAWLASTPVTYEFDASEPVDVFGRLVGPVALAPGHYAIRFWFQGGGTHGGEALVAVGGGQVLARLAAPLVNPSVVEFDVPVRVPQIWLQLTDQDAARSVRRIEVEPQALVFVSDRAEFDVRAVEQVAGTPNAYMAYVNEETYPEGGVFWTRATNTGEVVVVPVGARALRLTLHVGPSPATVTLTVGGQVHEVALQGDETRAVTVPIDGRQPFVRVSARASAAFRPADVDRQSADMRLLGCQVRVETAAP